MKLEDLKVGMPVMFVKPHSAFHGTKGIITSIAYYPQFGITWNDQGSVTFGWTKYDFCNLDFKTPEYHQDFEALINEKV